jgi:hypothetical protein
MVVLATCIISAHAVLVFGGYWNSDEYFHFSRYRDQGLSYLGFRLLHDSPRPLSEIILYLYGLVVEALGAPLIAPFLAILWGTLIGTTIVAAFQASFANPLVRVTLGLSLLATFLLGHGISEMFYWPMAAAAYLPALACVVVATFQVIDGATATPRGRFICGAGICLAALSVESGMFIAFGFAVAMAVLSVPALLPGGGGRSERAFIWWLIPLLISGAVLACALQFRVGLAAVEIGQDAAYFHQFIPDVGRTLALLPSELAFGDAQGRELPVRAAILLIKVLVFLGFCGILHAAPLRPLPWRHVLALAVGLCASIALTVLASLYQYGAWGMTRHRTWIQCVLLLLLLVLARLATSRRWLPVRWGPLAGSCCLIAAMGIGMATRTVGLFDDYLMLPGIRADQRRTWASGEDPSTDSMRLALPPAGHVLDTLQWRTGHFVMTNDTAVTPWYIRGVLDYFNKKSIDIVPAQVARQPEQS